MKAGKYQLVCFTTVTPKEKRRILRAVLAVIDCASVVYLSTDKVGRR